LFPFAAVQALRFRGYPLHRRPQIGSDSPSPKTPALASQRQFPPNHGRASSLQVLPHTHRKQFSHTRVAKDGLRRVSCALAKTSSLFPLPRVPNADYPATLPPPPPIDGPNCPRTQSDLPPTRAKTNEFVLRGLQTVTFSSLATCFPLRAISPFIFEMFPPCDFVPTNRLPP